MNKTTQIDIQESDFDLQEQYKWVRSCNNGDIGAVASFIGLVRDTSKENSAQISTIHLSTYQALALKQCQEIADKAHSLFPLQAIRIIHRYGELTPDEQIVLVICASKHRKAAINATDFIMDNLKSQVAFWKKEVCEKHPEGKWIEPTSSDISSVELWKEKS